MIKKVLISWLGAAFLTASAQAMAVTVGELEITEPTVWAMPPESSSTAAYLTIENSGSSNIKLERATTPISDHVMLHNTVESHGQTHMQYQSAGIVIPAGKKVQFKPGSLHIMIMDLKKHPGFGESVPLKLYFSNGKEIVVNASVGPQPPKKGFFSRLTNS